MKALIAVLLLAVSSFAFAGGEMKKVCRMEGKKEVCKTIKVHKKLEGTKVPPK